MDKRGLRSQRGAQHFFGLLGVLAFFVIVWGVLAQWQKVATLSDEVKELSHRISSLEKRMAVAETR